MQEIEEALNGSLLKSSASYNYVHSHWTAKAGAMIPSMHVYPHHEVDSSLVSFNEFTKI